MSLDVYLYEHKPACPRCGREEERVCVLDKNITHNLGEMWDAAGIYDALYESEGKRAGDIIEVLRKGLADMKARPAHYGQFNASNGWGLYKHAVPWLEEVLAGCEAHPDALISVSR